MDGLNPLDGLDLHHDSACHDKVKAETGVELDLTV